MKASFYCSMWTTFTILVPGLVANADPISAGGVEQRLPATYTNFFNPATNHYYALTLQPEFFLDARAEAQSTGNQLVTINDSAENSWLQSTFIGRLNGDDRVWIGLSDELTEGVWKWDSGEPFSFTSWAFAEPNGGSSENYAELYIDRNLGENGRWNDNGNGELNFGIIESSTAVPEPSVWALLGLATLAVFSFHCSSRSHR